MTNFEGFSWERINFLHSIWWRSYGLGLCWKSCWQFRDVSAIAEQGLQDQDLFCFSCHLIREEVHKWLGEDTSRTADHDWPKGYSWSYGVMSVYKRWGKKEGDGVWSDGVCLLSLWHMMEPTFLEMATLEPDHGKKWTEFLVLFCLHTQLFLGYLLNCLNPTFTLLILFPIQSGHWVREWVSEWVSECVCLCGAFIFQLELSQDRK